MYVCFWRLGGDTATSEEYRLGYGVPQYYLTESVALIGGTLACRLRLGREALNGSSCGHCGLEYGCRGSPRGISSFLIDRARHFGPSCTASLQLSFGRTLALLFSC